MPTTPIGGQAVAAFARRLRTAMEARGLVSPTSKSGLDVAALAAAAGTSYEMARRYAEGRAMPRPDTVGRIAAWLDVPAADLAYGPGDATNHVNQEVLQQCITAVIKAQQQTGISIPPDRIARLAVMIYMESTDGRMPAPATIARMLKAMA